MSGHEEKRKWKRRRGSLGKHTLLFSALEQNVAHLEICLIIRQMFFIQRYNVPILVKHILTDFCALIKVAEHSRSLLHKAGYNGVQPRNESVTSNLWPRVYPGEDEK